MTAFFTVSKKVGETYAYATHTLNDGHPVFTRELYEAAQFSTRQQAEHWLSELMLESPWKVTEH